MPSTHHRRTTSSPAREKTKKAHKKKTKSKKSSKNEAPKVTKSDVPKIKIAALQEYEDISPATGEESDSERDNQPALLVQRSPSPPALVVPKKKSGEKKKKKKAKGTPKQKSGKHKTVKRKRSQSPVEKLLSVNESVHSPISPALGKEDYRDFSPLGTSNETKHVNTDHASQNDMEPVKKKTKLHRKHKVKKTESPVIPRAYQAKVMESPSPYKSPGQRSVTPEQQTSFRRSRSPFRGKSPSMSNKSSRKHHQSPSKSPYRVINRPYISPYRSPFRSPYRSPVYRSPPRSPFRSPYRSPYYSPYRSPPPYWSPRRSPGFHGKHARLPRSGRGYSRSKSPSPRKMIKSAIKAMKSKSEVKHSSKSVSRRHSGTESDSKHVARRNSTSHKKHETSHRKSPVRKKDDHVSDHRTKTKSSSSSFIGKKKDLLKVDVKADIAETMSPKTPLVKAATPQPTRQPTPQPTRQATPQPTPQPPPPPEETSQEETKAPLPCSDEKDSDPLPPLPDAEPPPLPPDDDAPALPPLPLPPVLPNLPDESPGSDSSSVDRKSVV